MSTTVFDKLAYVDRLKSSGVTDEHAWAHAEALNAAFRDEIVRKHDLTSAFVELEAKIESVKLDIIKWLVPLLLAQTGLIVALIRLL